MAVCHNSLSPGVLISELQLRVEAWQGAWRGVHDVLRNSATACGSVHIALLRPLCRLSGPFHPGSGAMLHMLAGVRIQPDSHQHVTGRFRASDPTQRALPQTLNPNMGPTLR